MTDTPPDDPQPTALGERIAKLEGIVEAEDKLLERGLEGSNKVQVFLIATIGVFAAAAVAFLVYLLQRLDTLSVVVEAAHK